MNEFSESLVAIVFFGIIFGMFFLWINSRHKERMSLIEKGEKAENIFGNPPNRTRKWVLNLGIFAAGIALGVLVGYLLETLGMKGDQAYTAAIFMFGGASLVAAFFISRKLNGDS